MTRPPPRLRLSRPPRLLMCASICLLPLTDPVLAQDQAKPPASDASANSGDSSEREETQQLESVQVTGNWLGSDTNPSVKRFPGARTLVDQQQIEESGASSISDVLRRVPGVQSTDNSASAGSVIALNIGVRGLTGRYSPRSTVLLDGIPLAVAPYGQPQLSFAPIGLENIESIDVLRGGGAVRYGPQNVGGIINFKTRAIPGTRGISGDVSVRQNWYRHGRDNTMYSAFLGGTLDNGLGVALLYSGLQGSTWREDASDRLDDLALKFRYALDGGAEVYGKVSYFEAKSITPGGLTAAQFSADPYQNTRPRDFWSGHRSAVDIGYLNTISDTQEFEVRTYYNRSMRQSALVNAARTQLTHQPRNYEVLGLEPRYTQRWAIGPTTHDVTIGYRFLRERGDDNAYGESLATGSIGAITTFDNATDAHSLYVDDKIAVGDWRITPGVRFERIRSTRDDLAGAQTFEVKNDKALPSLNIAYLLTPAVTLFANYNTSFGAVQNTQLNSMSASNPLRPELARTAEIGGRWQSQGLRAEATLFHMKFDNQIQQIAGSNPPLFQNVGATKHDGIETAVDYSFEHDSALAGLNLYANYSYTRALQQSGPTAGRDLPFYARTTDTVGARYQRAQWTFDASSTHVGKQFADNAHTFAESADGGTGLIPGWRIYNVQAIWRSAPQGKKGPEIRLGINNVTDKRYYTRNVDANVGKMAAAPRMIYLQGRYAF
ncbi:MAG: TonB-dependent siderophore receptor [Burkholderiaceae bacterium]